MSDLTQGFDCLTDTSGGLPDALGCIFAQLTRSTAGEGLFVLLVAGTVLLAFYLAGERIDLPAVMMILFGPVIIVRLPPTFADIGRSLIVVGLAGAFFAVFKKYYMTAR